MLTLTRKVGQSIILETEYGPVEIRIKEIRRNQVRIGFAADDRIPVWREELYEERKSADEAPEAPAAE